MSASLPRPPPHPVYLTIEKAAGAFHMMAVPNTAEFGAAALVVSRTVHPAERRPGHNLQETGERHENIDLHAHRSGLLRAVCATAPATATHPESMYFSTTPPQKTCGRPSWVSPINWSWCGGSTDRVARSSLGGASKAIV